MSHNSLFVSFSGPEKAAWVLGAKLVKQIGKGQMTGGARGCYITLRFKNKAEALEAQVLLEARGVCCENWEQRQHAAAVRAWNNCVKAGRTHAESAAWMKKVNPRFKVPSSLTLI